MEMSKDKWPVTPAIRLLREHNVEYTPYLYKYEDRGGTATSSRALGVDEHLMIKTLVMEDEHKNPLVVLMHGDREVSTKELARLLGVKTIAPCRPEVANKHTGYLVGGTSPFGTHRVMPVYLEETILELEKIYINGGKRGYMIQMKPEDIVRVLQPTLVRVGIKE